MGQYWNAVVDGLNYNPHDYDNGLKLMEHSWIGNNYVGAMCIKIKDNPLRVVWFGDYSELDDIKGHRNEVALKSAYKISFGDNKYINDLSKETEDMKIGYLVNVDKNEYLSLYDYCIRSSKDDWIVNPLPLLTAFPSANGRGGGDYWGSDIEYLSYWAGDHIMFTTDESKIDGFQEILPIFIEDR